MTLRLAMTAPTSNGYHYSALSAFQFTVNHFTHVNIVYSSRSTSRRSIFLERIRCYSTYSELL